MTGAQIQDYINTYIKKNGRKEIGGDHMNYALNSMMTYVDDQIGAISSENIGNANLTITDVVRLLKLSGGSSGYYFAIRNYLDTKSFFIVRGNGAIEMGDYGVVSVNKNANSYGGSFEVTGGEASDFIAKFKNMFGLNVFSFKTVASSGYLGISQSTGAEYINLNGSSGTIDALGYKSEGVAGITYTGPVSTLTIKGGIITAFT